MKRILAMLMAILLCTGAAHAEETAANENTAQVQQALIDRGYLEGEADGVFGEDDAAALKQFQIDSGLKGTGVVNESTMIALTVAEEDIIAAQQLLIDIGYLTGTADGVFGAKSLAALRAFQTDFSLTVTGQIDDETIAAMTAAKEDIAALQQALADLGYSVGKIDGTACEETVEAVQSFQRKNNLTADGRMDPKVCEMILAQAEVRRGTVAAQERLIELGYLTGEADGKFGPQSAAALKLFQQANGLTADGELTTQVLEALMSADAKGDEPRMLQARLIKLGYLTGSVDGKMNDETIEALKLFQRLHGLEITGEKNDETWTRLFSEDVRILMPSLERSDRGEKVKELQERLIQLGFLDDDADGVYGENTEAAVAAFQQHLGVQELLEEEITGTATSMTQERLFGESYSSYLKDLAPGASDGEVLRVERRLAGLGYMDAAADDQLDDYAVEAVKAFQSDAAIEATGTVDQPTSDALFAMNAKQAEAYVPHDIAFGDKGGVVRDVQNLLIRHGLLSGQPDGEYGSGTKDALKSLHELLVSRESDKAGMFADPEAMNVAAQTALHDESLLSYVEDVQPGASEAEILRVQRRLSGLYYLNNSGIDGDCGSRTVTAIRKFQEANGLEVTGVADEATQTLLFSEEAIGNWTKYKLEVSIADQRVYVYELNEDNKYVRIDTFICSTGLGNLTPRGVYTSTTEPLNRWHYFVDFECWAQYSYRITGPYYFHSILYSSRHESSVRMNSVYALGSKASHGCVRLRPEDARWIFQNCEAGTIVVIY